MTTTMMRKINAALVVAVCLTVTATAVRGNIFYWYPQDKFTGNFSDAASWLNSSDLHNGVPGSGDSAWVSGFELPAGESSPYGNHILRFDGNPILLPPRVYTVNSLKIGPSTPTTLENNSITNHLLVQALADITVRSTLTAKVPVTSPTLDLSGGELDVADTSFTLTSSSASQAALIVGVGSTVKIAGGVLELTGATGNAAMGMNAGESGEIDVDGAGSRLMLDGSTSTITVGDNGSALLKITNGGAVDDNVALVGVHSAGGNSGSDSVTVDGPASRWHSRGHLEFGNSVGQLIPPSTLTLVNGGTTAVDGQFLLGGHGNIRGDGFVTAQSLVTSGVLSPGAEGGTLHQSAALHIDTDASVITGGKILIQLAGVNAGTSYDQVLFTGSTTLGGELDVTLANSFIPLLGNSFHILDYGTQTGTFSSVNLPPLSAGLAWNTAQLYTTGVISVIGSTLFGDYNGNGVVDAADYVVWRKGLGTTYSQADYSAWRSHFGQTAGSGSALPSAELLSAAVPEPGSAGLLLVACFGLCALWRRPSQTGLKKKPSSSKLELASASECRRGVTLAGLLIITVVSTPAYAAWDVTILNPAGAGNSWAFGGNGTQQVGVAVIGSDEHAGLWSGSAASWVDLNPAGSQSSRAEATSGTQQCGSADGHAGLWSGTAASWFDLNPAGATSSVASGISGTRQAGYAYLPADPYHSHAGMWNSTGASWVDLNPTAAPFSYVYGVSGAQVVGTVAISPSEVHLAALWNGAADSWVDLNPTIGFESSALATDGTHQVGWVEIGPNDFGATHASLWSGTAASWVDLNPVGATGSGAAGLFGTLQVGHAVFGHFEDGGDTFIGSGHASLWNSTAASWEDLSLALPGSWQNTEADSIWSDGTTLYIAGSGSSFTDNRAEAILWSRPLAVPEPGSAGLLLLSCFGLCGILRDVDRPQDQRRCCDEQRPNKRAGTENSARDRRRGDDVRGGFARGELGVGHEHGDVRRAGRRRALARDVVSRRNPILVERRDERSLVRWIDRQLRPHPRHRHCR